MVRVKALLVDLDGTLVDTEEANYAAYGAALEEAGVRISRETFAATAFGRSWRQFLPILLGDPDALDRSERIARRKAELYADNLHLTTRSAGLIALIGTMRPVCRTALVTSASRANSAAVLGHHDLGGLFDLIVAGDDVTRHKPDPEAYQLAAERLGVTADECLVFEDSDVGVAAATTFGARVIRVTPPR